MSYAVQQVGCIQTTFYYDTFDVRWVDWDMTWLQAKEDLYMFVIRNIFHSVVAYLAELEEDRQGPASLEGAFLPLRN